MTADRADAVHSNLPDCSLPSSSNVADQPAQSNPVRLEACATTSEHVRGGGNGGSSAALVAEAGVGLVAVGAVEGLVVLGVLEVEEAAMVGVAAGAKSLAVRGSGRACRPASLSSAQVVGRPCVV